MVATATLAPLDVAIIICSLLAVFGVGAWSAIRRRNATAQEYFLSENSLEWWVLGASLFASNIGAEQFIGMAGTASKHGIVVACLEWLATWPILILGIYLAPVYIRCKLATIPQWFEMRFNRHCRVTLICATMVVYGGNKIAGCLYGGALFFRVVFGWHIWVTVPTLLTMTGMYTIGGGLDAIVFADVIQTCIFMTGGLLASYYALSEVGGFEGLWQSANDFELDEGYFMSTWRPIEQPPYTGPGLLTGYLCLVFWYWVIDQEMAQRVIGAKTVAHARVGSLMAATLKLTTPFIVVIPGMVARVLYERCIRGMGHKEWCETRLADKGEADNAYAYIVVHLLPVGVVGILASSIIAAVMSSLGAVFNSLATILTLDIYKLYRPEATDDDCVFFGRAAMGVMVVVGAMWIPVLDYSTGSGFPVFVIIQTISGAFAPTLTAVVILGLSFTRINGEGALAGMLTGITLGTARLVLVFIYNKTCSESGDQMSGPPTACWDFCHFSAVLAIIVAAVTASVSMLYPPQDPTKIAHTMLRYKGGPAPAFSNEASSGEAAQETEHLLFEGTSSKPDEQENNPIATEDPKVDQTEQKVDETEQKVDETAAEPAATAHSELDGIEDPTAVKPAEPKEPAEEPVDEVVDPSQDHDLCGTLELHYIWAAMIVLTSLVLMSAFGTNLYGTFEA